MKLLLQRTTYTNTTTIGDLYVDGKKFCYVLEDKVRDAGEAKIWGKTAIPAGTYQVIVNQSTRFKRLLPRLLNVPSFDGVLIHQGNYAKDTDGCLLVGLGKTTDMVTESVKALNLLFPILRAAYAAKEHITITIKDSTH